MKFRFCGELDCPDWVLAEIATLAKITSIKMKLLCAQVMKDLLGGKMDYEKVHKLTADAKFESGDIKASVAALNFILSNAAKYSVSGDVLSNELQQLGLPKEHSTALCKSYGDNQRSLQEELRRKSLRLSHFESIEWRVDYIIGSSELKEVNEPSIQLLLKKRNPDTDSIEKVTFTLSEDKFRVFLSDLKQAKGIMDGLA
ncbi:COMM domain-containing protein 4-like [Lineus longissimus]|uniref:COMM domain-containing protein 4-like n=1 Tax=Lineus longissimus TaxID=88925 RepID=UPI002B4E35EB